MSVDYFEEQVNVVDFVQRVLSEACLVVVEGLQVHYVIVAGADMEEADRWVLAVDSGLELQQSSRGRGAYRWE